MLMLISYFVIKCLCYNILKSTGKADNQDTRKSPMHIPHRSAASLHSRTNWSGKRTNLRATGFVSARQVVSMSRNNSKGLKMQLSWWAKGNCVFPPGAILFETSTQSCQYKIWTADCGLRAADCGLRAADCGLRTADCGLRTADCGLRTADCGLRTADWLKPVPRHSSECLAQL